jgi:hypothetical protein
LVGDIGGLAGGLTPLGGILVAYMASQLLVTKLFKHIYQMRKYKQFEEDYTSSQQ